jgi:hypothetical protein
MGGNNRDEKRCDDVSAKKSTDKTLKFLKPEQPWHKSDHGLLVKEFVMKVDMWQPSDTLEV